MFNSPIKPSIEYAALGKRIRVYFVCVIIEAINIISS